MLVFWVLIEIKLRYKIGDISTGKPVDPYCLFMSSVVLNINASSQSALMDLRVCVYGTEF